jgi:hypothetical protein
VELEFVANIGDDFTGLGFGGINLDLNFPGFALKYGFKGK